MARQNTREIVQKISVLANNGQLTEARDLCEQACRNDKKNPKIQLILGDINQQLRTFDKAEVNYRQVLRIKPDSVVAHTRLAMLLHSQGMFCAAAESYRHSLKLDPQQPIVHFNLAAVLQAQGKTEESTGEYLEAIRQRPNYAMAHANLGYLLRERGKLDEALTSYRKALQCASNMPDIHYNLGLTLLQQGKPDEAETHHRKALELKPDYADAWSGLAAVQFFRGNFEKTITNYQRALSTNPESMEALCGCARTLSAMGEHEKAQEYVKHALDHEPNSVDAQITLGSIYQLLGKLDKALNCCELTLKTDPAHTGAIILAASIAEKKGDAKQAYKLLKPVLETATERADVAIILGAIGKTLGREDEAIEAMETVLVTNSALQTPDRCRLHFSLGKAYDAKGDYTRSFAHYESGNRLKGLNFDIRSFRHKVDSLTQVYSKDFMEHMPRTSAHSERPVFIVGMPRSGTSLVEQILASHPKVFGAGELPDITNLVTSLHTRFGMHIHYPHCLPQVTRKQLNGIAHDYLERLTKLCPDATRITDKMPGNFMHLGLIELLFPDARIIHCIRNPLDTCLSCYFQDFSLNHPYIYNLTDLGKVYQEYQRTMRHWKQVLNIRVLDVHYEELATNQEPISHQLLEFCDLEWDDRCLSFHNNKRFIWTASYEQVRRPMYKNSVDRWKNYDRYIDPLRDALGMH